MTNLLTSWSIIIFVSPILFFLCSKIEYFKLHSRNLFRNYFTYFIIFECLQIVTARLIFMGDRSLWDFSNLLFLILPVIVLIAFALKKDIFIWHFIAFSFGTIVYYVLNIFEPGMSLALNLTVIIRDLLIVALYLWYLKKNFKDEFLNSYASFKYWLFDFDKEYAMKFIGPLLGFAVIYGIIIVMILIKFKGVIVTRLGF